MKFLIRSSLIVALTVVTAVRAQDIDATPDESDAAQNATAPALTPYQYGATQDPLLMLQEIVAANAEVLRKQAVCAAELDELKLKAQAAKSSAAKSMSRGAKK